MDGDGALSGLVVVDATQMLAGPLAGMRLGDLGADVVKVEPAQGEFNRTHGFADARIDGEMSTFVALNRNKKSLCLDLKHPDARSIVRPLIAQADVFIQNFRAGTAERLGVGYEELSEINPGLVYCSISGYGTSGPYRTRPGQDLVIQGYSGSMFSVGSVDDPPLPGALWAADTMTGYQAVIGILAALQRRQLTGRGQRVDVDMLSVIMDAQLQEFVTYLNTGTQPTRSRERSAHASIPAPYGVYRTLDGWLTLAMCPLPSLGEVLDDDWLRSLRHYNDGSLYRDEIFARIRGAFVHRTTAQWISICDEHGVWAGPVHDYAAVAADPHIAATGMITTQPARDGSAVRTMRPPVSMSESTVGIREGAPRLGEHTSEILARLGFDEAEIGEFARDGVVRRLAHIEEGATNG